MWLHSECKNYIYNSYIGYTTTTLSRCLTYYFSENSAIKQNLIIKHNKNTNQLTSSNGMKIFTDNLKIIMKTITAPRSNMHKKYKTKHKYNCI